MFPKLMRKWLVMLCLVSVLPAWVSCGSEGADPGADAAGSGAPAVRRGGMFGDDSQALLERYASTNPAMQAGRGGEGATENSQVNQHFDKAFSGRKYEGNLKDYRKRSFWGRKDYARQVYGGDTDGSEFLQRAREASRQASQSGARSREAGRGLAHQPYVTGSASEAGRQGLELRSDAETETRRRVYPEPEIRNWQRRRALSVEDTRAMLGR